VTAYTEAMLDKWRDGEVRDLAEDMAQLTLIIIIKILFSVDLSEGEAGRIADVMETAYRMNWITHPKLNEVLHQDFANCSALAAALSGQDAAIFCLGTYTGSESDAELRKITVDYTVEFARVLHGSSPGAAFSFLSGSGADQTGRSRMAFARYKGEEEKALLAAGFPRLYIFRPAYIYPVEPRKEPNFSYRLLRAIYPAFRVLFPNQVIPADDLAPAMVDVAVREARESGKWILENRDIRTMVASPR
jgi:uncharacterized protein YbjT (DUF2867 family)